MISDADKDVLDTWARAIALESIHQTGRGNYTRLEHYILFEASYEDIVLEVFGQDILMEQQSLFNTKAADSSYIDTDVDRAMRLSRIENSLQGVVSLAGIAGLARIAGGEKLDTILGKGFNKVLPSQGRVARTLKGGTSSVISHMVVMGGMAFLLKLLFVSVEKSKSVCRAACKRRLPPNDPDYKLKVKICARECKIFGFERRVQEMRQQVGYCKQTANPEKCQANLIKIIAKYNDFISIEKERLNSNRLELERRMSSR